MDSTQHAIYLLTRQYVQVSAFDLISNIINSKDKRQLYDLLDLFDEVSISEAQAVLQNERICEQFIIKIFSTDERIENLISVLFYFQLPEKCIKNLARRDTTKRDIFDYLVRMESSPEKILLLEACVQQNSSLNQFFKIKTGLIRLGVAKDKLDILNRLLKYLKNRQTADIAHATRSFRPGSFDEHSIDNSDLFSEAHDELVQEDGVLNNEISYFNQALDLTGVIFDCVMTTPKVSLLMSAGLLAGAYYYNFSDDFSGSPIEENANLNLSNFSGL